MRELKRYLSNVLGESVELEEYNDDAVIPKTFQGQYDYFIGKLQMTDVIFIVLKEAGSSLKTIKKQYMKLRTYVENLFEPILVIKGINSNQRNNLMQTKIPFIVIDNSVYLPFVFLYATEKYSKPPVQSMTTFTPSAQVLYLHLFYSDMCFLSASVIAKELKMNVRTMNRAVLELKKWGLLEEAGRSTKRTIMRLGKDEYWKHGKKYLASPVKREFLVSRLPDELSDRFIADETALARYSDLQSGEKTTYAVNSIVGQTLKKSEQNYDGGCILDDGLICIQVWKYDPIIFCKNGVVDPISLYASLRDKKERSPREKIALDQLEERIVNGGYERNGDFS